MIAGWMIYGIAVSALLGGAAVAVELALIRWRLPTRTAWAASLAGLALVPLASIALARVPRVGVAESAVQVGEVTMISGLGPAGEAVSWFQAPTVGEAWDPLLITLWASLSLAILGVLLVSHANSRRHRREWRSAVIDGAPVLLSRGTGPAVIGFFPGAIVLPEWVEHLPARQRELLIRHEVEHLRARDPLLFVSGLLLMALVPWNLPGWWQLRRLRGAVEVDCDRRVIGRTEEIAEYGSLLLEVARRCNPVPLTAAAFGAHPRQLERRVRIMTRTGERYRAIIALAASIVAVLVLLVACGVEQPTGPAPRTDAPTPVLAPGVDLSAEPAFTPMEERPQLSNRAEFGEELKKRYPPMLKDAGIGGTVTLWVFIDEEGMVRNTRLVESSGNEQLDAVAESLLREVARFTPARNRGEVVPVWVQLPVTFQPVVGADGNGPAAGADPPPAAATPAPAAGQASAAPTAVPEEGVPTPEQLLTERRAARAAMPTPSGPAAGSAISDEPVFTPMTVRPRLLNRQDFGQRLEELYPPNLKARGIGGTTTLWVFIDEEGLVGDTRITQSSGEPALDEAAVTAMQDARFTPARNRDETVPVWVQLPVTMQAVE